MPYIADTQGIICCKLPRLCACCIYDSKWRCFEGEKNPNLFT